MTARTHETLHLNAFLMATGHHVAGWRHPDASADGGLDIEHYRRLARTAEQGCFDAIFLSDTLAMLPGEPQALSRMARTEHFEPLTLLAALAATTRHIGLIATVTTSYNDVRSVAASFSSLQAISGNRCGWNLVTSSNAREAANFGREQHFAHAERYGLAERFRAQVQAHWAEQGGAPVQVLAGDSEAGRDFAARYAEVLFTARPSFESARSFYLDVKGRMAAHGRTPGQLKIMPGILPIIGDTASEAQERHEQLQALIQPEVGLSLLSDVAGGTDLSRYPLDGPLPELPLTESGRSRQQLLVEMAHAERLSIRQLYLRIARARGHLAVVGTATQIADQMEHWFRQYGADGFNVMPAWLPGGLDDFVQRVIPELQRRGLFRSHYTGQSLRERFGLAGPENVNEELVHG
ncbi:LLM class flavin-dependent oxidoreductase [Stutzerimonas kirkiae]|uniref:Nitrilotriacetate monooxygenase n=1 Tax=Stutzerimonas kirkiae TaxID=2211392 RepID=A0A4Q9QWX0_9GAMM|nr:LLM class flavin-dependent oxidoreductase [Stutzerimonas kirkiae]TBU87990.1 nitrilotriacetate monooxygenase [Stutzerimonas kirkiae]TBU98190.1 nitrilotriacetate monooxygenase [Stutzerimonas kirkiae]TBV10506.1 nitrilotriacetate monooxygenase [Stutzerimonas kirkiae]TBV13938.1 nitrilotriacetate monooxygenase [Stutzerimonas kirkiae]